MLEKRADYDSDLSENQELKLEAGGALTTIEVGAPRRTAPRIAHVWIYPHELEKEGYFWGGWVSIVVEGDRWAFAPSGLASPESPDQGIRKNQ